MTIAMTHRLIHSRDIFSCSPPRNVSLFSRQIQGAAFADGKIPSIAGLAEESGLSAPAARVAGRWQTRPARPS